MDVRVGSGKTLPPGVPVTATLRFVVERLGKVGTNPGTTFHQLYADERVLDSTSMSGSGGMAVQFPLPSGDYATAISSLYRRFWQLHLHADTPGLDFDEAFVLPVYPRP